MHIHSPRKLLICFFLLMMALPLCTVHAKLPEGGYTDTEKVGFAFYKFANIKPNFTDWDISADAYKNAAAPLDRIEYRRKNAIRLDQGYNDYDPDTDLIHVIADIQVVKLPDPTRPAITLSFNQSSTDTYFPFKVGKLWIAVIPRDIDKFEGIHLSPAEYSDFVKKVSNDTNKKVPALIELWLRPLTAETKTPSMIDRQPYWPLLADIASVTIWNTDKTQVAWSYDAPGSAATMEKKNDLVDLYGKR